MVPVGDIQKRNGGKRADERRHLGGGDPPDRVTHAIGRVKVVQGRLVPHARGDCLDVRVRPMNQEHRSGLSLERERVSCAVVFLVAACPLVFPNHVVLVVVQGIAGGNADLLVGAHPQPVEIE